ncbi:beta-lactamase [Calothrix parasitica NIES-267]|uniref:Beta-lactamase n=1 Tax=Calothrix parasitica NIES-267 TaxID=1973488 RepID=A0A1Z4M1R3_9CYAN|nr:beta-lactamase [Calothrix parasitica NIES-267]
MIFKIKLLIAIAFIFSLFTILFAVKKENRKVELNETSSETFQVTSNKILNSKLQKALDKAVKKMKVPGAVMYISGQQETWVGASGFSNLKSKTSMKPNDRFGLASSSKTFVAVAVLQLVEQDKLDLDEAISNYLPQKVSKNIPYSNEITIRQLLNHTSGVVEYYDDKFHKLTYNRSRSQLWTATEAIELIYGRKPKAKPGKEYQYCDSNYILLEIIVEQITGKLLAEVIREQILNPLGLKNTFTELREQNFKSNVIGYSEGNKDGILYSHKDLNEGNGLGDGGLIASASDTAKFLNALLADKSLLSPKMLEEMLNSVSAEKDNGYGLGIAHFPTPFGKGIGHSGWAYGFVSLMLYFPDEDITAVVLVNKHQDVTQKILKRVLKIYLQN